MTTAEPAPDQMDGQTPLRVLALEDVAEDTELVRYEFRRAGIRAEVNRVDDRSGFIGALSGDLPDLIISDYSLPSFNGISALQIAQELCPDVPFIFMSGTIGEDFAVEMLKLGATDYVLKHKPARFIPAVRRALEEARARRERAEALDALRRSENELSLRNRLAQVFLTGAEDQLYVDVLDIVLEVMDSPVGVFGYVDRDGAIVASSLSGSVWEEGRVRGKDFRLPPEEWGDSLWGNCLREAGSVVSNSGCPVPQGHFAVERVVAVPIVHQAEVIGTILAANREREYDDDDLARLEAVATFVAPVLKARLERDAKEADRESAEKQRAAIAHRFEYLARLANDAILLFDGDWRVVEANERALELYGYGLGELTGLHLSTLRSPQTHPGVESDLRLGGIEGVVFEAEDVRRDGTLFPVEISGRVMEIEGAIYYQWIVRDISARKRLEEQFLQSQRMEAIGLLAEGVAHDFNNLLTPIIGYTELALSAVPEADDLLRPDLVAVKEAANQASAVARQLLVLGRKHPVTRRPSEINRLVQEFVSMMGRIIGEDIALEVSLDPNLRPVDVDPAQIQQVLMNLSTNARDAMPRGGTLKLSTSRSLVLEPGSEFGLDYSPGEYCCIVVEDTGNGIDPQAEAHLFEPFFTNKPPGRGTGLGLTTVYGIVKAHEGFIRIHSSVGAGTTVTVCLPCSAAVTPTEPEREASPQPITNDGTGTILLVEDEAMVRNLAATALKRAGFTVISGGSWQEAEEAWRLAGLPLDLLLADVVLPDGRGSGLRERISAQGTAVKTLFMSGYGREILLERSLLCEDDLLLEKPFTPGELVLRVREVLEG